MKWSLAQAPAILKVWVDFCQYVLHFIAILLFLINLKGRINHSDHLKIPPLLE